MKVIPQHDSALTSSLDTLVPSPGSAEERERFVRLQQQLVRWVQQLHPAVPSSPQTIVVVPSLSLDARQMSKIAGVHYYEERMLYLLLRLRQPQTHVVYLSSQPIADATIDYYLQLLPDVQIGSARDRLTVLSCHDPSGIPLSQKILQQRALIQHIRHSIADAQNAHVLCFNTSALEQTLAVQLDVPLYACDPALSHWGSKSGSREAFRRAGVALPDGFEGLRDRRDLVMALAELKRHHPTLRRAVSKIDNGFSGIGNATFSYDGAPTDAALTDWIDAQLPDRLVFEAVGEDWEHYQQKFVETGGIVECMIEGAERRSPSVQCYIDALGNPQLVSTHDQVLGGPSGQVYLGCTFPADPAYCHDIQEAGLKIAAVLAQEGVIGRFGVDFISVRSDDGWNHYATEINLRKGGTTHPFMMLQYVTNGAYQPDHGLFLTPSGQPRYYYATDNLKHHAYKGLTPDDFNQLVQEHNLRFDHATQQGVTFHLMGALAEYGKLGTVCISESVASAKRLYHDTMAVLNHAAERR